MRKTVLVSIVSISVVMLIAGCATKNPIVLSQQGSTMQEIFTEHMAGEQSGEVSGSLGNDVVRPFENDLNKPSAFVSQPYQRMDNPELIMYVYPRRVSTQGVIMPGYSVKFPMYKSVHYSLPGGR